MYHTIFRVDEQSKIVLDRDAVKLCPGLKKINQDDLLFIVLAYDYDSPLKRLDENERILRAKRRAYSDDDVKFSKAVLTAIEEYRSLQYDEKRETVITYQSKIRKLRTELLNEQNQSIIKSMVSTIKSLQDSVDELTEQINRDTETLMLSAGGKLSTIEKWQQNQKAAYAERQRQNDIKHRIEQKKKTKELAKTEKLA
jgi:hypothetical protein